MRHERRVITVSTSRITGIECFQVGLQRSRTASVSELQCSKLIANHALATLRRKDENPFLHSCHIVRSALWAFIWSPMVVLRPGELNTTSRQRLNVLRTGKYH